jgi:PadR family transcriptional regulator PadR
MAKVLAAEAHKTMEEHSKLFRDLLLGFVKIHVLHHAEQEAIYGVGFAAELQRHGYNLSPGTLYPLLHNMEAASFLQREDRIVGGKVRKYYRITPVGRRALKEVREKVGDLVDEVLPAAPRRKSG